MRKRSACDRSSANGALATYQKRSLEPPHPPLPPTSISRSLRLGTLQNRMLRSQLDDIQRAARAEAENAQKQASELRAESARRKTQLSCVQPRVAVSFVSHPH